jgi:hypothetical protein
MTVGLIYHAAAQLRVALQEAIEQGRPFCLINSKPR